MGEPIEIPPGLLVTPGTVFLFNPTATDFWVNVNNAPPAQVLTLDGTQASQGWAPTSAPLPRSGDGQPAPGKFGWQNDVELRPVSGQTPARIQVNIPTRVQIINDLQLYFYWDASDHPGWMLLSQGQLLGGSAPHLPA